MQNFPAMITHPLCKNQRVTLQLHDDSAESPRLRVASQPRSFFGAAISSPAAAHRRQLKGREKTSFQLLSFRLRELNSN